MKKLYIIGFMLLAIGLGSCKKGFLSDLAVNPNSPSTATPQLVFPSVLTDAASLLDNYGGPYQMVAAWMGYFNYGGGYSFNSTAAEYLITTSSPQPWDNWYRILTNNEFVLQNSTDAKLANFKAAALIMKSFGFQYLVDVYNKVPYTQAFQGIKNLTPKYDDGSIIYDSLVANIDNALNIIQSQGANAQSMGTADVMFGGDMTLWAKFGNTVKLRLLVRQSQVAAKQAYIKSEAAKTQAVGYLGFGEDAVVNPGYSNTSGKQSPFWSYLGITPGGGLASYLYLRSSQAAMDFYKNTNDPRLGYVYATKGADPTNKNVGNGGIQDFYKINVPENPNDYAADPFGKQAIQTSAGSGVGPGLLQSYDQNAPILIAAESYFLQAEAALRGYITGDPETLYHNGITASFEYFNVHSATKGPDELAADYYNQDNVKNVSWPGDFNGQLEAILTQKWAALDGVNPVESWNDWRRTGYPNVPLSVDPANTQTHMPYRFYYPIGESQKNAASYTAAGGDKVDPFVDKVFWMQ